MRQADPDASRPCSCSVSSGRRQPDPSLALVRAGLDAARHRNREPYADSLDEPSPGLDGVDEIADGLTNPFRWIDEFDPRSVADDLLIDVADPAVRNAAFEDDRSIAQCQPKVVEGIEVERKRCFDKAPARTDFLDGERLKNHHFAVQLSENFNPFPVPLLLRRS